MNEVFTTLCHIVNRCASVFPLSEIGIAYKALV